MPGENSQIEFQILATELVKLLIANEDSLLKDNQPKHCSGCSGIVKYVHKSPDAYRISQLLKTIQLRGLI